MLFFSISWKISFAIENENNNLIYIHTYSLIHLDNNYIIPSSLFRSVFNVTQESPVICRVPPQVVGASPQLVPPKSSGSESSGYFTPPPDNQQAFVKLDTEETMEPEQESKDCADNDQVINIFYLFSTLFYNFFSYILERIYNEFPRNERFTRFGKMRTCFG